MKVVAQRVSRAQVSVDGEVVGQIGAGLLILLGVAREDREKDADFLAKKVLNLRVFPDEAGKMNLSALQKGYGLLVISQFTLLGECRKGNRPDFTGAELPERAKELYEYFVSACRREVAVETGRFAADMKVELVNDGPVTLILESGNK